jgi:hypothetical protein
VTWCPSCGCRRWRTASCASGSVGGCTWSACARAARGAIVRQVKAGSGSVPLAKQLRLLRPGRISFAVTATDAADNRSQRKAVKLVLRR